MNHLLPLVLRPSPSFVPVAIVGLPVLVETAGQVVAVDGEARVWINRHGDGETIQLRVQASGQIDDLPSLPIVAAGAVRCGDRFVVTGANSSARAVVTGLDADGDVLWQHEMESPSPTRWPAPGCAPEPVVIWQAAPGKVEVADATPSALVRRASFAVGGPPLDTAAAEDSIWAVWSDETGVWATEATRSAVRTFHVDRAYASQLAVGSCADGVCVVWGRDQPPVLAQKDPTGAAFGRPVPLDVADVAGGMLNVIPGGPPLVHVRGSVLDEDRVPQPVSVITAPGVTPLIIEGLVHGVACRDDAVIVLGSTELRFLKRVI